MKAVSFMYGPPGTGKASLAGAVAHHTDCTFIRVKYIGKGSRMVDFLSTVLGLLVWNQNGDSEVQRIEASNKNMVNVPSLGTVDVDADHYSELRV
ncbi:hypothetical protein PVL29_018211 [Vitis rotundifolia]|uniref:ATPase AAA-type core domain-containing protein n=1 Tax=Vitis rotundifolia TaxID=103349 RepID=A0AA38Z4G4_VITRO|nr:hypothetical protein PVL29_018211 [Vitis rotundifolia]